MYVGLHDKGCNLSESELAETTCRFYQRPHICATWVHVSAAANTIIITNTWTDTKKLQRIQQDIYRTNISTGCETFRFAIRRRSMEMLKWRGKAGTSRCLSVALLGSVPVCALHWQVKCSTFVFNKNSAIANRSHVSWAHSMSRTSMPTVTAWP